MNTDYVEEREPLDTKSMLEDAFFANLGKTGKSIPKVKKTQELKADVNFNTEKLLLELFEVRDNLVEVFSSGSNSQHIITSINKVGSCIRSLGGEAQDFDPFAHLSGLQKPNIKKNAMRVIENTKEVYSIGRIEEPKVEEDGKTIIITFAGQKDNVDYKAVGTLVASKNWVGNEAIDYVYTPGEGRMSVKVFNEDGKWVDKSNAYKISWELFEKEADLNVMPLEVERKDEGKDEKNVEIKEEVKKEASNKDIDEEIGDFPIEEKTT